MAVAVSDYVNVRQRALELGYDAPTDMVILPRNFHSALSKTELVYEGTAPTVRTLLRQSGLSVDRLERKQERIPYAKEDAFEWAGPTILVGAAYLSQNPHAINLALNVVGNYLTDWFKGIPGANKVTLDIVIESRPGEKYKRVHYEGPPSGLEELGGLIRDVQKDQ